jgi:hypothetical protein
MNLQNMGFVAAERPALGKTALLVRSASVPAVGFGFAAGNCPVVNEMSHGSLPLWIRGLPV